MSESWTQPTDMEGYFRNIAKRMDRFSRYGQEANADDLLGPGFADRSIRIEDWNAEEATFNGSYYSLAGAANSPDDTARWVGTVLAQDDLRGLQMIWESPDLDDDTPPRTYIRFFYDNGSGFYAFSAWGSVKLFSPIIDGGVITGAVLQTSLPGTGARVVISDDVLTGGIIEFPLDITGETPGFIRATELPSDRSLLLIHAGKTATQDEAYLHLDSGVAATQSEAELKSDNTTITGELDLHLGAGVSLELQCGADIDITSTAGEINLTADTGVNVVGTELNATMDDGGVGTGNFRTSVRTAAAYLETAWTTIAITAPWTAIGTTEYRRDSANNLHLAGAVTRNAAATASVVCTLPVGFRPSRVQYRMVRVPSAATAGAHLQFQTNGDVLMNYFGTPATLGFEATIPLT